MEQSSLLPDSGEVTVECVKSLAHGQFLLVLRAASEQVFCPPCHRLSFHVHSYYLRHLSNLPWEAFLFTFSFMCGDSSAEQLTVNRLSLPNVFRIRCCVMRGAHAV